MSTFVLSSERNEEAWIIKNSEDNRHVILMLLVVKNQSVALSVDVDGCQLVLYDFGKLYRYYLCKQNASLANGGTSQSRFGGISGVPQVLPGTRAHVWVWALKSKYEIGWEYNSNGLYRSIPLLFIKSKSSFPLRSKPPDFAPECSRAGLMIWGEDGKTDHAFSQSLPWRCQCLHPSSRRGMKRRCEK
jgi:hypothetical protein